MASTRSRPRSRVVAAPLGGSDVTEHKTKITVVTVVSAIIILAVLAVTPIGRVIDLATQHFMLFYAGVVVLMALCTSVAFGMVATDRMFLHPGQRVFIQAAHRAVSFGAFAFLIIHVITEILAQRANVIDVFIPFLEPFKAFYIGLGTIAGDLMILVVITSMYRTRFISNGKAWQWRAIHYTTYVMFVFGIWHGLLAGRAAKPYYDWTYGVIITLALFGLGARALSTSLRPKEALSAPPISESANSAAAPLRAAAMLAQFGATMPGAGRNNVLAAASTGAQRVALSAPQPVMQATAALPAAAPANAQPMQPVQPMQPGQYEPGYEGPARRMGAPRNTGAMQRPNTGAMPRAVGPAPADARMGGGSGAYPTQQMSAPPRNTGAMPRPGTGAMPRYDDGRPGTGAMPRYDEGRPRTGAMPRYDEGRPGTGAMPRYDDGRPRTGAMPQYDDGRPRTGAMPQYDEGWGPGPRGGSGPMPGWDEPRMDPQRDQRMAPPMEPRQRPMTGGMPQLADYVEYSDRGRGGRDQNWDQDPNGWPQDQGWDEPAQDPRWMEASHDGGGRHAEEPQWDNGYYREPEPQYRDDQRGYGGPRDPRYGGDRY